MKSDDKAAGGNSNDTSLVEKVLQGLGLKQKQLLEDGIGKMQDYINEANLHGGNPENPETRQRLMNKLAELLKSMIIEVGQIFEDLLRHEKAITELVETLYEENLHADKENKNYNRLMEILSLYERQRLLQMIVFLQEQIFKLNQELMQIYQKMGDAILKVFKSLTDLVERFVRIPELGVDLDQHAMFERVGHNLAEAARRGRMLIG